jgi:TfoX/Sxy family transcriptional regulator of competence genes
MASSKDYLQFILDQLSDLPEISYHQMMWEYILYFHWKIVGWIYDNRLLLKPTKKVKNLVNNLEMQIPYPWAKPMIYVDNLDDYKYLQELIKTTYQELYYIKNPPQ